MIGEWQMRCKCMREKPVAEEDPVSESMRVLLRLSRRGEWAGTTWTGGAKATWSPLKSITHYLIPPRRPILGNSPVFSGRGADLCHGNSISLGSSYNHNRRSHRFRLAHYSHSLWQTPGATVHKKIKGLNGSASLIRQQVIWLEYISIVLESRDTLHYLEGSDIWGGAHFFLQCRISL